MPPIELLHPYIKKDDINKALEHFLKIQAGEATPVLEFIAQREILDIDISFLGYLLLFKKKVPALTITLKLLHNNLSPDENKNKLYHKLVQTGIYSYLFTNSVPFIAIFQNKTIDFDFNDSEQFPEGWFILSKSFLPLFLISSEQEHLFEIFFEKGLEKIVAYPLQKGVEDIAWSETNDELYVSYNGHLRKNAHPNNAEKCFIDLGRLAFFKALMRAKILSFYTDPSRIPGGPLRKNIQAGYLKSEDAHQYFERVNWIFQELEAKPLVYHFIYSILVSSDLLPSHLGQNSEEFEKKLVSLWLFTKDLVQGLYELAKNIRDHSSTKMGVITTRIIRKDFLATVEGTNSDIAQFYTCFEANLEKEGERHLHDFLEIHVLDIGAKGIIPTLLENSVRMHSQLLKDDIVKVLIEEDIKHLQDLTVGLEDLLDPGKKVRLNQQCKRSVAHIGLLIFGKLIINNKGVLKVSTQTEIASRQTIILPDIGAPTAVDINYGTVFNIILPINTEIIYESPQKLNFPGESTVTEIQGIEELFSFEYIPIDHLPITPTANKKLILGYRFHPKKIIHRQDEWELWLEFFNLAKTYTLHSSKKSLYNIHLDFDRVDINASQLLRFLGKWETEFSEISLLLSNITNETYHELIVVNKALTDRHPGNLEFWNDRSPVVVYSYVTDAAGARFYFTDILLGRSEIDFIHWNKTISRNHFNSTSLLQKSNGMSLDQPLFNHATESIVFFNKIILLPFDLKLRNFNEESFFEVNASMLLTNEIRTNAPVSPPARMIERVKQFPGYKVSNSHYRIGRKLHISNFYYAKRIFQNNFFASRFAFLVADEIISTLRKEDVERILKTSLTLIGYGMYAELLMNLVEKFLKKSAILKDAKINHNLVDDKEEMEYLKVGESILDNIIIIVPIASTFSTAIKLEQLLKRDKKSEKKNIISPHYNLLHIFTDNHGPQPNKVEREFGWEEIDRPNKKIRIKAYYEEGSSDKMQKYFMLLPSKWQKIEDCRDCFPLDGNDENPLLEKALFETDRTFVTPSIIFDFPRGRFLEKEDEERMFNLNADMIRFGDSAPRNSHFIYSIDTEKFLQVNLRLVKKWLREIKAGAEFSKNFTSEMNTLIVSSCHQANAAFIDLVNEELFLSSANIIHYDPQNDYIQNFRLMYGSAIEDAEKIIFVDDTLKSGETFSRINEFVQYISIGKANHSSTDTNHRQKGIDACILLIDKSQPFEHQKIVQKLVGMKRIYGFGNLFLFSSLSLSNTSTLSLEKQRYSRLLENSFLDSLRVYFSQQIKKLTKTYNTGKATKKETDLSVQRQRHLLMLEATHLIYMYFSKRELVEEEFENFSGFLDSLYSSTKSPFLKELSYSKSILNMKDLDLCILKVLTQYPFTQYEPLRKIVFRWVIKLLDEHVYLVQECIEKRTLDFSIFQGFKFLIRRATLLNSNYLLSYRLFTTVKWLFTPGGFTRLEDLNKTSVRDGLFKDTAEAQLQEIHSFTIFFIAQVKEILSRNPLRSLKLETLLISLARSGPSGFEQILRVLKRENAIVIQKFYQFASSNEKWLTLYVPEPKDRPIDEGYTLLHKFLSQDAITRHPQYRSLQEFLLKTGQPPMENNEALWNYLWIKNFIDIESGLVNLSLTERSRYIFNKVSQIFEKDTHGNISLTGIFLSILSQGESYLVYDKNNEGNSELDSGSWHNIIKSSFLGKFQEGIEVNPGNSFKTLIELGKNSDKEEWVDMYGTGMNVSINELSYTFFPPKINRLVLLRLNKRKDDGTEKKLGMVGIYFANKSPDVSDANTMLYLQLLKNSLSEFVERHHLNNEFRDWLIAENTKKLALLTGHGKETIRELAKNFKDVSKIAEDLENLQIIILLNENFRTVHGIEKVKVKFNQFYNLDASYRIHKADLLNLCELAKKIFENETVETNVKCMVELVDTAPDFSFPFNLKILNLICLELFINAKKNRWHFLDDIPLGQYAENKITISAQLMPNEIRRQMELKITNTGPSIFDPAMMDKLNSPIHNVKANDITAGTALIKTIVLKLLDGEIKFNSEAVVRNDGIHIFSVTLTFNEMTGNETEHFNN